MPKTTSARSIIAIQADPIESWKYETDTTLLLAEECAKRGHEIFVFTPNMLSLSSTQEVYANGRFVSFTHDPEQFFKYESDFTRVSIDDAKMIFIRQNPPFNEEYLANTLILSHVKNQAKLINNPASLRNVSEKLWAYHFPEFIPASVVTSNAEEVFEFAKKHKKIVIKSIFNFGGNDVSLLDSDSSLFADQVHDAITKFKTVIAQEFFESIKTAGDKRILIASGKIVGAINRVPAQGSILSNMAAGGTGHKTTLSAREEHIGNVVGQKLLEIGIHLAGLDLIEEHLIEVNVTSPTGFKAYNTINNEHCEVGIIDALISHTNKV